MFNMNPWIQLSIDCANQRSSLDDLFKVYPTIPDGIRELDEKLWKNIEGSFKKKDNAELIENLVKLNLFPIKDSYVAYLKRDKKASERNPQTIARLVGRLYEMGLDTIYARCSEPKETNRQIGPLFISTLVKQLLFTDMKLINLIIDILEKSEVPLKQGEILALAEKHPAYMDCIELQKVQVPLSAVARCLTKYSGGSKPVFGVYFEGRDKKSQKRFFLKTKDIPEVKNIPESSLHPYFYRFVETSSSIISDKRIKKESFDLII